MKKRRLAAGALLALWLLTSCGLLPKEEELPTAPVVHQYEESFTTCAVERGSVVKTEELRCSYLAVKTETLRFALGGEQIAQIFVQVGSVVHPGDVIAELSMGTMEDDLREYQDQLELCRLQLRQTNQDYSQAASNQQAYRNALSPEERKFALTVGEVTADYASQAEGLQNQITVLQERIDELEQKCEERRIVATIDGAVTALSAAQVGDLSSKTDDFVTISDNSSSAFVGTSKYKDLFSPGEQVVLSTKDNEYAVTVVTAEAFGMTEEQQTSGYYSYYFQLNNPDFELKEGNNASVQIELARRDEVLWLPDSAIHYKGDTPIVYYENEDGIRDIKTVELGLSANHRVEIVSGLSEGDRVIIP